MNTATQSLSPTGTIQRSATCPRCGKKSSEYLGAMEGKWTFRCSANSTKDAPVDHVFAALEDPSAPRNPGEVSGWMAAQKLARMEKKVSVRHQS